MDNIQDFLNTIAAGQDTKPSDVVVPSSTQNDTSQYLSHGQNTWNVNAPYPVPFLSFEKLR